MDLLYDATGKYTRSTELPYKQRCLLLLAQSFPMQQRYVLTLMGFFGLVMAYSMRLSLSVAITQMVTPPILDMANLTAASDQPITVCPVLDENYYKEHYDQMAINESHYNPDNEVYNWSQEQQGIILSSFFWGYLATQILGGIISQCYGGKYVFAFGILFSAFCSLLTPITVRQFESIGLIALRVVSGLGEGLIYSGLTDLLAAWVPLNERTTLGSLAYGGSTVGTIGGTYVAAILIHSYKSWHPVFYCFGIASIVWSFLFILLCYNDPESHPFITDDEKAYLLIELGGHNQQKNMDPREWHQQLQLQKQQRRPIKQTPWRQILTCVPFIALILCQISHEWAFCVVVLDLPKYMNDVLHFSIQDNGLYSSIPQITKLIMALATGALSDWLINSNRISITNGRKIFVAIASVFTGIFIVAASYAECDKFYVVIYFTISVAFQGVPGVAINALDLSPNYAGILMGIGGTVTSLTGILVPYIIGVATPNSLLIEWRIVFWITFVLQILKLFIFSLYGSGDVQSWDTTEMPRKIFQLPGEQTDSDEEDDDYVDGIADGDTTDYNGYDSDVERLI